MKWFDDADAQHCVAGECLAAPPELEVGQRWGSADLV